MEHLHGVDVSWMTHGSPRDKAGRTPQRRNTIHSTNYTSPDTKSTSSKSSHDGQAPETPTTSSSPRPVPGARPGSAGSDKLTNGSGTPPQPSPQRRGSWFSNISSKFSSSSNSNGGANGNNQNSPQPGTTPPKQTEMTVPRANPVKNAVLQHATRYEGDGPYTPAPPKASQAGLLQVLRRLSSSSNGGSSLSGSTFNKKNHGLVARQVLNVDRNRERCALAELNQAKLRRVAFCVDVEIAPMPKYTEGDGSAKKAPVAPQPSKKKPLTEKGEGEALKVSRSNEEAKPKDANDVDRIAKASEAKDVKKAVATSPSKEPAAAPPKGGSDTKKKEKKKRSEEERKARKEKKRKLAELNGQIPMEISIDSDYDSSGSATGDNNAPPRTQSVPTTNPVRIYRRCCQLRETPILKKITEQLSNPNNVTAGGVVEKLDLAGYWLHLSDLVTLGDYLAVVPIKEVILENCGLNDEGLRVILSGLLASRRYRRRGRKTTRPDTPNGESEAADAQGGVVERLVLRNNKIGPEGWKHLCLFIYMCRSITQLDISNLPLPRPASSAGTQASHHHITIPGMARPASPPPSICQLLSRSLTERLAGSTLELLNIGETAPDMQEFGTLMDGIIACKIKRLGLAHNDLNADGVSQIKRFISSDFCYGLDLGGNDLRDQLDVLADALPEDSSLSVLSLAECNLSPQSLCKLFSKLVKLQEFRFIDLSHNQDLCRSEPSCISLLRRYLPKMTGMKRIHLADVSMNSEQAIALAEILPEVPGLAHINLLENPELSKLADAKTEESQEEACAFYASMLAATRVSSSIVAVDMDVPTENSGEIVKAMAKQVVAYCLRNMENLPLNGTNGVDTASRLDLEYPDVLQHLVGHPEFGPDAIDDDNEAAPDDDYVIGGTGVVKALACCLKNRGDDSRRPSGEFTRNGDTPLFTESTATSPLLRPTSKKLPRVKKAKDMSKHLLASARKIRQRLQPAMARAKLTSTHSAQDAHAYQRLLFLDRTLDGIIKRFEDEFPETREPAPEDEAETESLETDPDAAVPSMALSGSFGSEADRATSAIISDGEDEDEGIVVHRPTTMSRSSSMLSITSKGLTEEEGRALRAGHKFRSSFTRQQFDLVSCAVEEIEKDPNHARMLLGLIEDLGNEELDRKVAAQGVVAVFKQDKELIQELMRAQDPEHWERFVESQHMARANVKVEEKGLIGAGDEVAIVD
ncbi:hypothetical protein PpBr36_01674 [Pyricularia pennisetigena]|uniref:hypothetical protein n=1 Tax=Pyricularia pennisetigena TaxID=1578925 RepID=UPI00114E22FA|nr:hypothetical protein PpBr36_01674 [Pyricularia pennisetigena]TLS29156.1 hypothetical protein PpBr36_01674 [Pyricularia pennisetigena]